MRTICCSLQLKTHSSSCVDGFTGLKNKSKKSLQFTNNFIIDKEEQRGNIKELKIYQCKIVRVYERYDGHVRPKHVV
jgi:hypothetical protein